MSTKGKGGPRPHRRHKGLPRHCTIKQGRRAQAEARIQARKLIELMEDEGKFSEAAAVPGTDDEKAKSALQGVAEIGLNKQIPVRERIAALKVVLEFTKEKPAQKQKVQIDKSEAWLNAVMEDAKSDA